MSELDDLYQEIILDHNKNPRNFKRLDNANHHAEGYNPLCGDKYIIFINVEDDTVKDIGLEGEGCAISKASASVMGTVVKGKQINEVYALIDKFHKLVTGESDPMNEIDKYAKIAAFSGVGEYPIRVKCATLAWHTLKAALDKKEELVTTE